MLKRNKMKKLLLIISFLWGSSLLAQNEEDLKLYIYQIRVTEGHATLLVVKHHNKVVSSTLIDAGKSRKDDAELIAKVINNRADSKLDHVFITHYDTDHYHGLVDGGNSNPSDGILKRRCGPSPKLSSSSAPSSKLKLYRNKIGETAPSVLTHTINAYSANIDDINWTVGTVLDLSPVVGLFNDLSNKIKLQTLAVHGELIGSTLELDVKNKNSRSGVALITWGDFSFLVQGDLQGGGGSKQRIGRTNAHYRPTKANELRRIPSSWTGSTTDQNASDLDIKKPNSIEGIKRKINSDVTKKNVSITSIPLSLADFPHDIGYPIQWHHELGDKINDHNGSGEYAHACLALIPHHGAPTSNLWFDSKYAIVGSNATNSHGHPVPQAIVAAYHTAGVEHFFFTYLQDKMKGKINYDRFTELMDWKDAIDAESATLRPVNFHRLMSGQEALEFKVSIDPVNASRKKIFASAITNSNMEILFLPSFSCDH